MGFFDRIDRAKSNYQDKASQRFIDATPQIAAKNGGSEGKPPVEPTCPSRCSTGTEPSRIAGAKELPDTKGRDRIDQNSNRLQRSVNSNNHRKAHGQGQGNFTKSWPWLRENLPSLLQAGWTRRALFQRSAIRYPAGHWGVAWFDVWAKPDLAPRVGRSGTIEFSFSSGARQVRQTATRPPARVDLAMANSRKQK